MATTYTTYFNLGKQEDTADKFSMAVITNNADIIDSTLHTLDTGKQDSLSAGQLDACNSGITAAKLQDITPTKYSSTITSAYLEDFGNAIIVGEIDSTIHGTDDTMGVVRSYQYASNYIIQIAEFIDGTRKTRYLSSGIWSNWI